jgi:transmembrane sensor
MSEDTIADQAAQWAVRTGDPAFDDWDGFTAWLEADPAHARAYERVTAAVADAADLVELAGPANDDVPEAAAPRHRPWRSVAAVAALALVGTAWVLQGERRDLYTVQTAMGETRSVILDVGTSIELAGGSAVQFDRKDHRFAKLDHGQALFTVRHNEAHPFAVDVGDAKVVDVGTVFDVRHDADGLSVAVSEGAVQFDPEGANVRVAPGEVLRRAAGASQYTLAKLPPAQVGEWREGRLTFDDASFAEVAAQLSRATGQNYTASTGGTVSGSILVAPLRKDPAAIGPLLGVKVRAEGKRWVIGER